MPAKKSTYFEFEVSLEEIEPRIWRRFLLRANATLHDLHDTIQKACGWLDCHLYLFRAEGPGRAHAVAPECDPSCLPEPVLTGPEMMLQDIFAAPGDVSIYEYDFGDGWLHRVELTGMEKRPGTRRRILLAGARAFPPEDCGGTPGYEECLRAFRATDEEISTTDEYDREELLARIEWLGDWDPEHFDLAATQRLMPRPVRVPGPPPPPPAPFPTSHAPQEPPSATATTTPASTGRVVPIAAGRGTSHKETIDSALEAFLLDCYDDMPSNQVDYRGHYAHELQEFLNAMGRAEGFELPPPPSGGRPIAPDGEEPTYCETAEPAAIARDLSRFLGTLALRKMSATLQFDRAARAITPDLMYWLNEQGHLDEATAKAAETAAARLADDLAEAECAAIALAPSIDYIDFDVVMDEGVKYRNPSHLEIVRIERDRLWLTDPDESGVTFGPIEVPPESTVLLEPGWRVVCALARYRKQWYIAELLGVLPPG